MRASWCARRKLLDLCINHRRLRRTLVTTADFLALAFRETILMLTCNLMNSPSNPEDLSCLSSEASLPQHGQCLARHGDRARPLCNQYACYRQQHVRTLRLGRLFTMNRPLIYMI